MEKELKDGTVIRAISECIMDGDENDKSLTVGKLYQVTSKEDGKFTIIDDTQHTHHFGVNLESEGFFEFIPCEEMSKLMSDCFKTLNDAKFNEVSRIHTTIENEISDSVSRMLYYDRKEDDELPVGVIDKAVRDGEISVDDMVNKFREELEKGLEK